MVGSTGEATRRSADYELQLRVRDANQMPQRPTATGRTTRLATVVEQPTQPAATREPCISVVNVLSEQITQQRAAMRASNAATRPGETKSAEIERKIERVNGKPLLLLLPPNVRRPGIQMPVSVQVDAG